MEPAHTCCFTGGRPQYIGFDQKDTTRFDGLKRDLAYQIKRAAENGYTDFICGMSRGFDLWAGECMLELCEPLGLKLHAAIPFRKQTARWSSKDLSCYEKVLRACSSIYLIADHYERGIYHTRNRFMVENSSLVIAWNTGRKGSGTEYTCKYAKRKNIEVVNLAKQFCEF